MYSFGEVAVLPFSFTDLQSAKRRPALILLDADDGDVLVARITSKQHKTPYDIELTSWKEVGLLVPSYVRLHKLITVDQAHILKSLGTVSDKDLQSVRKTFNSLLG